MFICKILCTHVSDVCACMCYANIRLVFTLPFPCTVCSFTGSLWRVLCKQASLALTQPYPTLTTPEATGRKGKEYCMCGITHGAKYSNVWASANGNFFFALYVTQDGNKMERRREERLSRCQRLNPKHCQDRAGHGMYPAPLCHLDTPLTVKLNQHLPSKCCPSLHLRFPSLFWLV